MSELTEIVRGGFDSDGDYLGNVEYILALCVEAEALEKENALLADAYDIKSVPCSKCGAETGSLGRRITYLIAQNEAFRKQLGAKS